MDGSLGPQRDLILGFQPEARPDRTAAPAPDLDHGRLPEPEWSLSATQVALVVVAIIAFCELIGNLL